VILSWLCLFQVGLEGPPVKEPRAEVVVPESSDEQPTVAIARAPFTIHDVLLPFTWTFSANVLYNHPYHEDIYSRRVDSAVRIARSVHQWLQRFNPFLYGG
jgi:hypothetical protein